MADVIHDEVVADLDHYIMQTIGDPMQLQRMGDAIIRPVRFVALGTIKRRLSRRIEHPIRQPTIVIMQNAELHRPRLAIVDRGKAVDGDDHVFLSPSRPLFQKCLNAIVERYVKRLGPSLPIRGPQMLIAGDRVDLADFRHRASAFRRPVAIINQTREALMHQCCIKAIGDFLGNRQCSRIPGNVAGKRFGRQAEIAEALRQSARCMFANDEKRTLSVRPFDRDALPIRFRQNALLGKHCRRPIAS